MDDRTTFFLAFLAVFAGLALVLLHLERRAKAVEARIATLEAALAGTQQDPASSGAMTTKAKGPAPDGRPKG